LTIRRVVRVTLTVRRVAFLGIRVATGGLRPSINGGAERVLRTGFLAETGRFGDLFFILPGINISSILAALSFSGPYSRFQPGFSRHEVTRRKFGFLPFFLRLCP
jgi:hypothetical protein